MEGGQDEVPREGGLDRDLRRLGVPDLPHHDDVGVLPEDRPQSAGEREVDLRVDLDLPDAVELVSRPGPRW